MFGALCWVLGFGCRVLGCCCLWLCAFSLFGCCCLLIVCLVFVM